jgi:predicted nucleotidyltransferase
MRLTAQECASIKQMFNQVDPLGSIYLYGSRADDARKGGDIDIYFEATQPIALKHQALIQYRLSTSMDCKVDLLVKNPDQSDTPFYQIAREGIVL